MMSAVPRYPAGSSYVGLRLSADEFFALGETPERYELINGVVVMAPSAIPRHQRAIVEILRQFTAWDPAGDRAVCYPDTDVQFSSDRVYRPDLSVYRRERMLTVPARLTVIPDLIIEVLSPATRPLDLITKREDYERFAVAEYWVIDPDDASARHWLREGTRLVERPVLSDRIPSSAMSGFMLDLWRLR